MRKSLLAIAATGSMFAVTAAFATGIDTSGGSTVHGSSSKTVTVSSSSVCTDTYAVAYVYDNDNGTITDVTLSTAAVASADCAGEAVTVTLSDGSEYTQSGTTTISTGKETTVHLTTAFDLGAHDLANARVAVGPQS